MKYLNLSEGADRVGGQLRGDNEYPFSGVTKSGRVWRKVPEKRCSECDQYPNLSEGADRVGGQLRGDKECPFSGVTKSGRVWRKVPESDAFSADSLTVSVQPGPCYRMHSDSDYVSTQFYNK